MKRPEQVIQRAVVQHLRARCRDGVVWFHPPNGGARSAVEAAIFQGLGVRAGVSDMILLHRNQFYAMELKADGGKATPQQAAFLAEVRAAGGLTAVCDNIDDAIATLERWQILKGTVQ
jgi:VRR-NUC domain